MESEGVGSPLAWAGFLALVAAMLALDLGVLQRRAHRPSPKEALAWSLTWIGLSLAFCAGIGLLGGWSNALLFLSAYLVEKALSVDNLFVFIVLFGALRIPAELQHRVLFWGVLGALVMRALMIFAGVELLSHFHALVMVLGAFLVWMGLRVAWRFFRHRAEEQRPPAFLRWVQRQIPSTGSTRSGHFFVREHGRRLATPLFVALVSIELADVLFAVDSVPAVLAITPDSFLVFTSNVLAILGLRSLYFVLAGMMKRFVYLPLGLAGVLGFVGAKMLASSVVRLSPVASLAVIATVLAASITASFRRSCRW